MSSEVETSLDIPELNENQTVVRDPLTTPGMRKARRAFTIIELIVVIALIIMLAGLILSTVGYVQNKGARSRAEAEIAAMSAALENYKADNGAYPTDSTKTEMLDPAASINPTNYAAASLYLYEELTGDTNADRQISGNETGRNYFSFKPKSVKPI
jgi:type II secretory pathway pseudopilin PulG